MLFLFGLIPTVSADNFSSAKNTEDVSESTCSILFFFLLLLSFLFLTLSIVLCHSLKNTLHIDLTPSLFPQDPISRSSFDTNSSLQTVNKDVASFGAVRNDGRQGNFNLRGGRVLQGGCAAGESYVLVTIDTDGYPEETWWDIKIAGEVVAYSGGTLLNDGVHDWSNCLSAGDYTFTIYDDGGDGMYYYVDDDGVTYYGSYKLSVDGVEKFDVNGANFGDSDSRDFTVCPAGERFVVVTIDTDGFPQDTSWKIFNKSTSAVVASIGSLLYDGVHTWSNCLPGGNYTFTIYDSNEDGMNYFGDTYYGSYKLSVNNVPEFEINGKNFGDSDSIDFTVPSVSTNEKILICNIYNCKYSHD